MPDEPSPWRLIPPIEADGTWQMAIDRWLLARAVAGDRRPVLRFYRWSHPTLSLGHHQHSLEVPWPELVNAGSLRIVRRPSGGRAVLHSGDLTYALVWPQAPAGRRQAYGEACRWLVEGFERLGMRLSFGAAPARNTSSSCFSSSTAADLVEPGGGKRVGSAQLWSRGCLLQHGSVLMEPPPDLWQEVFGCDPPELARLPVAVSHWRDLAAHLSLVAAAWLPGAGKEALERFDLSPADWDQIRRERQAHGPGRCPEGNGPPGPGPGPWDRCPGVGPDRAGDREP
jgi:lipoate-protein ligase A